MAKSTIPSPVLTELNRQFNQELSASHAYLALSICCDAWNLQGFASYFAKQAGEERKHAEKLSKHLLDRNATPEIAAFTAPKQNFSSLVEVAEQALSMEQANTRGINAVYEAALAAKDYPGQALMLWFIGEQVEEEAWATEMVDRVHGATCAGSLSDLDRHIEKLLASES